MFALPSPERVSLSRRLEREDAPVVMGAMSLELEAGSVLPFGSRAVLVGASGPRHARQIAAILRQSISGVREVVLGLRSVMVESVDRLDPAMVSAALVDYSSLEVAQEAPFDHLIEVTLDGDDLEEAMERTGLSRVSIGHELETAVLEVATIGFSPGFGYLTGLSGPLASLPRRPTPRPSVPAGSLAVAASLAALYPQATPGGWWLLGRCATQLFDVDRPQPSLLGAGDRVRFVVVGSLAPPRAIPRRAPLSAPSDSTAVLEVLTAPPGCSLVDDGRFGMAHLGVPRGGAADPERAGALRSLLGGAPGCVEISGSGLIFTVLAPVEIAGLDVALAVDGRPVPSGIPLHLGTGQSLEVVSVGRGDRGYLGVVGGPVVDSVLGSIGTDSLARIGPGWLAPGDQLGARQTASTRGGRVSLPGDDGVPAVLRVVEGPHSAALLQGIEGLADCEFTVGTSSNRVGIRLEPSLGGLGVLGEPLASLPMVTGAVQLPPDGRPIVLGVDHATLGGYPVVAVVIDADIGILGRLTPGDRVMLQVVTTQRAAELAAERTLALTRSVTGITPRA